MGLSPDVLHRLLVTEDEGSPSPEGRDRIRAVSPSTAPLEDDGEVLEFEFESDEASPPMDGMSPRTRAARPKEVMLDPILDEEYDGEDGHRTNGLLATSPEAGPSSFPNGSAHHHHRKFRIRLLSNGQPAPTSALGESPKPMSVMDVMGAQNEVVPGSSRSQQDVGTSRRPSRIKKARLSSHSGGRAEYVLTGEYPFAEISRSAGHMTDTLL